MGIYLNNAKGSKMEYYLDYRGSVKSLGCTANGAQDRADQHDVRLARTSEEAAVSRSR